MVVRLQIRHDISANWKKYNPVLAIGEMGIETDDTNEGNRIKIGDGNRKWSELPYIDEKSVHKFADEIIYGKKSFEDTLNLNKGCVIPDPYTMDGLATRAVADEDGNNFNDYYQKTLKNATNISNTTDWNTLIDVGYYKVDLASWGNATTKHSPNSYNVNVNKQGILSVIGNDTYVFQKYTPLSNETTLCRYCDNNVWSNWAPLNAGDSTVVHTSGNETISGVKTFSNNVNLSAGDINFNRINDASILKEGTAFITNTASGNTIIASDKSGTINFRPNGPTNNTGEVIIDSTGVIQGMVTSDSAGNSIIDTYARKDEIKGQEVDVEELKYSIFDRSKFTIEGTLTISDNDGVASGFSSSNYIRPKSLIPLGGKSWEFGINFIPVANSVSDKFQSIFSDVKDSKTNFSILVNAGGTKLVILIKDSTNTNFIVNEQSLGNLNLNAINSAYLTYKNQKLTVICNDSIVLDKSVNLDDCTFNNLQTIGYNSSGGQIYYGLIDLKQFSFTVDGKEVFNGNKTGIDTIKPDNYKVVGAPTITDDGIVSDFTTSSYITGYTLDLPNITEFTIYSKFTTPRDLTTTTFGCVWYLGNKWGLRQNNGTLFSILNGGGTVSGGAATLIANTEYEHIYTYNTNTGDYVFKIKKSR